MLYALLEAVPTIALAALYVTRVRTLSRQGRAPSAWRQAAFFGGLVALFVVTATPLAELADELIVAHMAQHLVIADFASLLLVLGLTGPLLQPLLAPRWLRPLRALTHPVAALGLFTFNLYLWHVPALYQAGLDSDAVHLAEHASFLFTGILLWMPLVGPLPTPSWFGRAGHAVYTVGIWLPAMGLANLLMWSGTAYYPEYGPTAATHGLTALSDQSTAGGLLMVQCMLLALALFTWSFLVWARQDSERQSLIDFAERNGIDLDPERAGRAVSAGAGEDLRRRLEREAGAGDAGEAARAG